MGEEAREVEGLQFDKAEGAPPPAPPVCHACAKILGQEYFQVDGKLSCAVCKEKLVLASRASLSKEEVFRAFLYGGAAAVAGSILWYAVAKITGLEIGLIGIIIGVFVGRAVRRGGGNRGTRGLQVMAVVLTYFSIVSSYLPAVVEGALAGAKGGQAADTTAEPTSAAAPAEATIPAATGAAAPAAVAPEATAPVSNAKSPPPIGNPLLALAAFFGICFAIACAAPFLAGAANIMGLIIIAISLWEAWRVNRATPPIVVGPLTLATPSVEHGAP